MRIAALALTGAVAVALAGCAPVSHPTVTPTPRETPVFASDDAALAAAEKAYAAYSAVADQVLADGGSDPERIDSVTTGDLKSSEHRGSENFATKGYRSVGATQVKTVTLESANLGSTSDTKRAVVAYVCVDVSAVNVLDRSGTSVVAPDRNPHLAYEVTFDLVHSRLLPSRQDQWNSAGVCP